MLQIVRSADSNGGIKQGQTNREVRVGMQYLHKNISNREGDTQLLPALADEGLLFNFPRVHLAPNKLPQHSSGFMGWALADQEPIPVPNQGSYHIDYLPMQSTTPSICWLGKILVGGKAPVDGDTLAINVAGIVAG